MNSETKTSDMGDTVRNPPAKAGGGLDLAKYDRRSLTYANSFDNPLQSTLIRAVEWTTGKIPLLKMIRKLEQSGAPVGPSFWRACLDIMRIELQMPETALEKIPENGPLVIVANHPHGLVDGMVMAELIGKRRPDYKLLVRALLTGLDEVASGYLIPVPFPHDADAQRKSVEMRAAAMAQLKAGGAVALFPSGVVASSGSLFGPAEEAEWNVFTAQMIRRSGARVVPVFFPGSNSRAYQMANRMSATLRQSLLIHEIVKSCNRPQKPVVGGVLTDEQMTLLAKDPRGFMAWLREHTLALKA